MKYRPIENWEVSSGDLIIGSNGRMWLILGPHSYFDFYDRKIQHYARTPKFFALDAYCIPA